jgi:DNA polymerase III epsilon subunit family exonuclease
VSDPLTKVSLTVFDLETTGFDPEEGAEPIEVGAVRIEEGEIGESFREFVRPVGSIPDEVQSLTGIEPSDVERARSPREVMSDFLQFADGSILVAHNTDFDMAFLRYFSKESVTHDVIDTLRMARQVGQFSSHKLDDLTQVLDIERSDSHRAVEDARATAHLFLHLWENVDTLDHYRHCEIPESVLSGDLECVLSRIPGLTADERDELTSKYETIQELVRDLKSDDGAVADQPDRVREILDDFFDEWEDRDSLSEYLAQRGRMAIRETLEPGNWSFAHWGLNLLGMGLIAGAVVGTRDPVVFETLVTWAIPCFVGSSLHLYIRSRTRGRTAALLGLLLPFVLAGTYHLRFITG